MERMESAFKRQWHNSNRDSGKRMAWRDARHGGISTHASCNLAVAMLDLFFLTGPPGEESDDVKWSYDSVRDPVNVSLLLRIINQALRRHCLIRSSLGREKSGTNVTSTSHIAQHDCSPIELLMFILNIIHVY